MMSSGDWLLFFVTLPWVLFLAISGGAVKFIQRLNNCTEPQPLFRVFLHLAGEMFTSVFAGLVTFLLCQELGFSPNYTAVLVAIAGYLGSNAIERVTEMVRIFGKKGDDK